MSLRYDLSAVAGFDLEFDFALTYAGVPLNLSGCTLTLFLKASATTPDTLAKVYAAGTGLTVTGALEGEFTWQAPAADAAIDAPGSLWYRVDVAPSGADPQPAMYGAVILTAA